MSDANPDDPLGGEAEAEERRTIMPWIWGGIGLLVVGVFIAWLMFSGGHRVREPAGAAPLTRPVAQHY